MSENAFHIIIKDHTYSPSLAQQKAAYTFFEELIPESEWSYFQLHEQPVLVGSDYSHIHCYLCDAKLSVMGAGVASGWWDALHGSETFARLDITQVTMPCCQQVQPLAAVVLLAGNEAAAGFSRFQLTALEPLGNSSFWKLEWDEEDIDVIDYGTELKPRVQAHIEALLGSAVLCIWERK